MANIVEGLFGLTPSQVQQQQQAQINAQAAQYAQADPFQRAAMGMYQGGAGLAGIGAGMMGMQNKDVAAAQEQQQFASQIDMTTPEGVMEGAKAAQARGDSAMAVKLVALARQMQEEQSTAAYRDAQSKQMLASAEGKQQIEPMEIEKLYAALSKAEQAGNQPLANSIKALIRNKTRMIGGGGVGGAGSASARQKGAGGGNLSATGQKALLEADSVVSASDSVVSTLQKALEINDDAYSGYGAKARAVARSQFPGESKGANATILLDNLVMTQALESLKSIFGASPTEGERTILLEIQASTEKTPAQRKAILEKAIAAANARKRINADVAEKLRSGEYFSAGGAPSAKKPPSAPAAKVAPPAGFTPL